MGSRKSDIYSFNEFVVLVVNSESLVNRFVLKEHQNILCSVFHNRVTNAQNMEKFQQGKPYPYIITGASNAPPPSYDQVYGGGYPQKVMLQSYGQNGRTTSSYGQQYPSSYTSGQSAAITYPPYPPVNTAQPHLHNPTVSNASYYPDSRRLITSPNISNSNSNNRITPRSTQLHIDDDETKSVNF